MALRPAVSKAEYDALPEVVRKEYSERDGKYVLEVEGGFVPLTEHTVIKTQLADFRDNNVQLLKALDGTGKPLADVVKQAQELVALRARVGDLDPEKARQAIADLEKLQGKGVKKPDDLEAAIRAAVESAIGPLKTELEGEKRARAEAQKLADGARFRELVTAEATKARVRQNGLRFVLAEAESKFELKDGALVPRDGVRHPADPLKAFTPTDWLGELARTDEYLFEASKGGGALPAGGVGNPGARQLINPTPAEMGANLEAIAKGDVVVVRQ